jgi:phosphate-selective porin OprO/OprP
LQYEIPALHGRIFVGRTNEGISTNKLMVGYQGWTMERATINDALLPILADGVKWMGNSPDGQFVYSLGWFGDNYSEKESFNRSDEQVVGRLIWLPFLLSKPQDVLHLGVSFRHASSDDGELRLRSKPESFEAQSYAIDTGTFQAQGSDIIGLETYFRPGSWSFGMEYFLDYVSSREHGDPFFHGGEIFASYILTGEKKPYNIASATFDRVSPGQSVFEGGRGAWEAVLRYSYSDLDSKDIRGGKFWRITPMMNWHMSDNVRLEFVYGYGMLDRFDLKGATHFFQTRLQLQL